MEVLQVYRRVDNNDDRTHEEHDVDGKHVDEVADFVVDRETVRVEWDKTYPTHHECLNSR